MLPPDELYTLDDTFTSDPTTLPDPAEQPVLLHALQGFVDAGSAATLATAHLLAELDSQPVAHFDVDQLIDYRSRRPRMSFRQDRFTAVESPALTLYAVRDTQGTPFLVLTGPEPDLQWERFIAAVRGLVERFGVRLCVGMHGIPWAAPHTRPVGLTPHASDRSLIAGRPRWVGDVEVPGHASALLEFRLGEAGHPAMGFTAHVPHYLSTAEFPPAAVALLEAVADATGLDLPTEALRDAGVSVLSEIDAQVTASAETLTAVHGLERQYDAVAAGRSLEGPGLLAPSLPDEEMPDGDELAADFERYLRQQDDDPTA